MTAGDSLSSFINPRTGKADFDLWVLTDLRFWIQAAAIYDTYGLPRDLMMVRLRESGCEFTDEEFNTLLDYLVMRRNGRGQTRNVTEILIRLPEHWQRDKIAAELMTV